MNPALLAAIRAEIDESIARGLPADPTTAQEAGRVFSAANEQALRAVAQAITNLLAQVQQAPAAVPATGQPPAPGQAPAPGAAPAPPAFQQQSAGSDAPVWAQESVVPLREAALKNGAGLVKVITPGWGTSGYYGAEVLKRDASTAWPAGTGMYWDHPPEGGDGRPERSLRDLAARFTEAAAWRDDGPDGPGVYAPVKVYRAYQDTVNELAPDIGVSIRSAAHVTKGTAEGKNGTLISRLLPDPLNTVDFVTIAGRGGRVAQLFEAARGRNDAAPDTGTGTSEGDDVSEAELAAAREAQAKAERERDAALLAVAIAGAPAVAAEALRDIDIPTAAKVRITERMSKDPTMKDGALDRDAFKAAVAKAGAEEKAYIDTLLGKGKVTGMGDDAITAGESGAAGEPAALADSFVRLGLSKESAAVATAGRR